MEDAEILGLIEEQKQRVHEMEKGPSSEGVEGLAEERVLCVVEATGSAKKWLVRCFSGDGKLAMNDPWNDEYYKTEVEAEQRVLKAIGGRVYGVITKGYKVMSLFPDGSVLAWERIEGPTKGEVEPEPTEQVERILGVHQDAKGIWWIRCYNLNGQLCHGEPWHDETYGSWEKVEERIEEIWPDFENEGSDYAEAIVGVYKVASMLTDSFRVKLVEPLKTGTEEASEVEPVEDEASPVSSYYVAVGEGDGGGYYVALYGDEGPASPEFKFSTWKEARKACVDWATALNLEAWWCTESGPGERLYEK